MGFRVAVIDHNPDAPWLENGDDAILSADFDDHPRIIAFAHRHEIAGVLSVGSDRAVRAVAAVAEALNLPGIDPATAALMTDKVLMRDFLTSVGIRQPRFTTITPKTKRSELAKLVAAVGLPAVLKPADSAGQRGLFAITNQRELLDALPQTLAVSQDSHRGHKGRAILETFLEGPEVNVIAFVTGGRAEMVTVSDRLGPQLPSVGFGVGWAHLFPSALPRALQDQIKELMGTALDRLRFTDGIAFAQMIISSSAPHIVEIAARMAAGEMSQLIEFGMGISAAEFAIRTACALPIMPIHMQPRFHRPIAIRFLTAKPGVLPTGVFREVRRVDQAEAVPGVLKVEFYLEKNQKIRPVQTDGDRRGYIIATGDSPSAALDIADYAAKELVFDVEQLENEIDV